MGNLLLLIWSEGVGKKNLIFESCPEGKSLDMPWPGKGAQAAFAAGGAVSWWYHWDASQDPLPEVTVPARGHANVTRLPDRAGGFSQP